MRGFGAALFLALLVLVGCSPRDRGPDLLVVYSAGPRPLAQAVVSSFEELHGAKVELFTATTGQIMAKLEAERFRPRADIVVFANRVAADSLKQSNRLLLYPDPTWLDATEHAWHDPNGAFYGTSAALVGIAFREDVYDSSLDWGDLLEGRYPGRITMPSPSRSGATGDFVVAYAIERGDTAWVQFALARRAGLDFAAANNQAISGLLIGAYQSIVGAVDYLIYTQVASGAPVRMHYPRSGAALVQRPVAILKDTPVPDLARSFVDHYLSQQVQERVAAAHLIPARRGIPLSEARRRDQPEQVAIIAVDDTEVLQRQTQILRRFQLEIERAEIARESR